MSVRSTAVGLMTTCIVLALMVGGVELVLRLLNYPSRISRGNVERLFTEYDSVRGWRNIAGRSGTFSATEFETFVAYNSRGFRGPEVTERKPPGVVRIILLGDSFTDGYTVPLPQRTAEVLQQLLQGRADSQRVEVIAMGTSGYSTDQQLLWFESEAVRYDPDIVVLMFYGNDVWYNARPDYYGYGKPMFVTREGRLTLTNVPVPRPAAQAAQAAEAEQTGDVTIARWLRDRTKLGLLAARAVRTNPTLLSVAARLGIVAPPRETEIEAASDANAPREFSVYQEPLPSDIAAAWTITDSLIARLRDAVQAQGARFVVFEIPPRPVIHPRDGGFPPIRTSDGKAVLDLDAVRRRLTHTCTALNLSCVFPAERMIEAARTLGGGRRLYFIGDIHWTAHGHRAAAEILADSLAPRLP